MGLQYRVIRVHFTDPDATDSDTHSDVSQTAGQQRQSCQKAAQPKQAVTQQCKFCVTSDEMCRYCQMPGIKEKGAAADPDATDSDTHSNVCQTARQQRQSCQKAAQPKQAVTQQCKFSLTSDEMCRYCQMPGMKAKGAAAEPDATDSDTHSDVCQTAGQQHQSCQKAAQPKQAVTQQCKFCLTSDEMCRYCQMPGMKARRAAAVQIKKRKEVEKEVTLVVSPLVLQKRKRIKTASRPPVHPQSFVSKEKQREDNPTMDIVCEANKSKSSVTSAAHITTGSTSSVHNTSTKPPGFWEDLSSQLLKQMEALTDADLQTGDFDSENDLIQLDHLPLWAGNLNWDDYPFFK